MAFRNTLKLVAGLMALALALSATAEAARVAPRQRTLKQTSDVNALTQACLNIAAESLVPGSFGENVTPSSICQSLNELVSLGSDGSTFANPCECTNYFDCSSGQAVLVQCPSGQVYTGATCEPTNLYTSFMCENAFRVKQYVARITIG